MMDYSMLILNRKIVLWQYCMDTFAVIRGRGLTDKKIRLRWKIW